MCGHALACLDRLLLKLIEVIFFTTVGIISGSDQGSGLIGQPSQGFNFSFDVTVVSKIADIIINIHIIINIADRVYGQQQFAESVEADCSCG
jgi:hypothetical protein